MLNEKENEKPRKQSNSEKKLNKTGYVDDSETDTDTGVDNDAGDSCGIFPTGYGIWNSEQLELTVNNSCVCKKCGHDQIVLREEMNRRRGWTSFMRLVCTNCDMILDDEWTATSQENSIILRSESSFRAGNDDSRQGKKIRSQTQWLSWNTSSRRYLILGRPYRKAKQSHNNCREIDVRRRTPSQTSAC